MRIMLRAGWQAAGVMAAGLCAATARAAQQAPASAASAAPDPQSRLQALWAMLLVSLILLVLFIIGALLIFRYGRRLFAERGGRQDTPYVDAWRQYRLSEDDLDAIGGPDAERDPGA